MAPATHLRPVAHAVDRVDESGEHQACVRRETHASPRAMAATRRDGRAMASTDFATVVSAVASQRIVAAALDVSPGTIATWCDPDDSRGPQLGDIYALALAGRPELATHLLTTALAAVRALGSRRGPPQPFATHLQTLVVRLGDLTTVMRLGEPREQAAALARLTSAVDALVADCGVSR